MFNTSAVVERTMKSMDIMASIWKRSSPSVTAAAPDKKIRADATEDNANLGQSEGRISEE